MKASKALEVVKKQLTEKRYVHTIGVMETAIELANRYKVDESKVQLAAIFHDYAKFRSKEEMKEIIKQQKMPLDLLNHHHELWHAPVGAYLVKTEVGINDQDILQAIRFHTTGNKDMSTIDKVVFLADYIEPNRSFVGVDEVRELARLDLDVAVITSLKNTIQFLLSKSQPVYPDTIHTYNSLMFQSKK